MVEKVSPYFSIRFIGINGVMCCFSRFLGAALLDRFQFKYVMSTISLTLAACLAGIFIISEISLAGMIIFQWAIFSLAFCHFGTIPAQVSLIRLYTWNKL